MMGLRNSYTLTDFIKRGRTSSQEDFWNIYDKCLFAQPVFPWRMSKIQFYPYVKLPPKYIKKFVHSSPLSIPWALSEKPKKSPKNFSNDPVLHLSHPLGSCHIHHLNVTVKSVAFLFQVFVRVWWFAYGKSLKSVNYFSFVPISIIKRQNIPINKQRIP